LITLFLLFFFFFRPGRTIIVVYIQTRADTLLIVYSSGVLFSCLWETDDERRWCGKDLCVLCRIVCDDYCIQADWYRIRGCTQRCASASHNSELELQPFGHERYEPQLKSRVQYSVYIQGDIRHHTSLHTSTFNHDSACM